MVRALRGTRLCAGSYLVVTPWGDTYGVERLHYADGPSLYVWVVTGPALLEHVERQTKGECMDWIAGQAPPDWEVS